MAGASAATIIAGRAYVLIEAMDKTGKVLKSIGANMQAFVSKSTNLLKKFSMEWDKLAGKMNSVGGKLSFKGLQTGMAALGLAIPLRAGVREAASFSDAMLELQAILGIGDREAKKLEKTVRDLGATTSYTSSQVAQAGTELGRGGFNAGEIEDSLTNVLDLARAGSIDLPTAAKTMVRSIRAFGMSTKDASRVSDILFEGARNGTTTVEELASALSFSAGTANMMGFSLEQTVGILSVMSNSMLQGTKGGTSLNQMLLRLGTRSGVVKEKLGFDVSDGMGGIKDAQELILGIVNGLKGMSQTEKLETLEEIFNVRGTRAAAVMQEFQKVFDVLDKVESSSGEAAKAAKKMDSGLGGTIRKILSAFNELQIAFGMTFEEPFENFRKIIIPIINGLSKWITENKELSRSFAIMVVGLFAVAGGLLAAGFAMKAFAFGMMALKAIVTGFVFLLSNPVVLAIVGTIAALYLLSKVPGIIGDTFTQLGNRVWKTLSYFGEIFSQVFTAVKDRILAGDIEGAMNILLVSMEAVFQMGLIGIKSAWVNMIYFLKKFWINFVNQFKQIWYGAQKSISKSILDMAANNSVVNAIFEKISGVNIQEEIARAERLGNGDALAQMKGMVDEEFSAKQADAQRQKDLELANLELDTAAKQNEYADRLAEARKSIDQAIAMNPLPSPEDEDEAARNRTVKGNLLSMIGGMFRTAGGSSVGTGMPEALEMGSLEASKKAFGNRQSTFELQKSTADTSKKTAENTMQMVRYMREWTGTGLIGGGV